MEGSLEDYIAKNSKLQCAIKDAMASHHHKDHKKKEILKVESEHYNFNDLVDDNIEDEIDDDETNIKRFWKGVSSDQDYLHLHETEEDAEFDRMYDELNSQLKTNENSNKKEFDLRQTLNGKRSDGRTFPSPNNNSRKIFFKDTNAAIQRPPGMPPLIPRVVVEKTTEHNSQTKETQRNNNFSHYRRNQKKNGCANNYNNNNKSFNNYRNQAFNAPNRNNQFSNRQQNNNCIDMKKIPSLLDIKASLPGRCINCCCDSCASYGNDFNLNNNSCNNFRSSFEKGIGQRNFGHRPNWNDCESFDMDASRNCNNQMNGMNLNNYRNGNGNSAMDHNMQNIQNDFQRSKLNGIRGNGRIMRNEERRQQNNNQLKSLLQSSANVGNNNINTNKGFESQSTQMSNANKNGSEVRSIASVLGISSHDMESIPAMLLWMQLIMQKGVLLKLVD